MPFAKRSRIVALLIASLLIPSAYNVARAADPTEEKRSEAKRHFRRGVELYEEQDYRAALVEFTRANELAPSYKVLYNVAQTHFQLLDYPKALEAFEQYLERGGSDVPAPRRKEVEEIRGKLRSRIATLDIHTNVDARILVDDETVGSGRSVNLRVSAGTHTVTAQAEGYRVARKPVTLAGEDQTRVDLTLEREPAPVLPVASVVVAPVAPPPTEPPQERSRVPFFVALTTTGVLAAGTAAFGIASLSAKSSLDSTLSGSVDSRSTVDDAKSRLRTYTIVTDVLGVSTIVAAVVTIVLVATHKSAPRTGSLAPSWASEAGRKKPPEPAPSWGIALGAGFASAQGSF
jgi:hypothetical protein